MTGNLLAMLLWIQEKQCNRGPWIFYDLGCSHSKLNGWISIDNHNILPEKTLVELMLLIYALHSNNIQWVLFPGLMILFFYTALKHRGYNYLFCFNSSAISTNGKIKMQRIINICLPPILLHCSQTGEVGGMRQRSLMILFICTASSNKVLTKSSLCDCTVCAT